MMAARPPRVADWLLQRLTSGPRQQSIIGDLHEQYGRGRSFIWYWRQTITTILVGDAMKQRLLWVLVPTAVTAALTATLSYYFMPTRYQSESLVLVVPQQVPEAYVRSTMSPSHIEERLQTITEQILSRTRLDRIIQDFDLYPELSKTAAGEAVVDQMRSSIGIKIVNGDAFRVVFTADEPRIAMRVTERLTSLFIEENLRDRQVLAEGTNQFLSAQIEDVRRQIVDKEAQLHRLRATTSGELSQGDVLPYEVLKESYKALLLKQLDARVGASLERRQVGEQFKILDPARLPEAPIGPSKTAVNIGGTLAGLGLGLVMMGVWSRRKKPSVSPQPSAFPQV
jgi:uncharacterized protein involved in exopolysaccharide biosynthesis